MVRVYIGSGYVCVCDSGELALLPVHVVTSS